MGQIKANRHNKGEGQYTTLGSLYVSLASPLQTFILHFSFVSYLSLLRVPPTLLSCFSVSGPYTLKSPAQILSGQDANKCIYVYKSSIFRT